MTTKLRSILNELARSGQSESIAVAETLSSIAENGGELATDRALLASAREIRVVHSN